jgi:hypothetical protein
MIMSMGFMCSGAPSRFDETNCRNALWTAPRKGQKTDAKPFSNTPSRRQSQPTNGYTEATESHPE